MSNEVSSATAGVASKLPAGVDWVAASDLSTYCYCAKLYHLSKVRHERPNAEGAARLKAGIVNHHQHGVLYDRQLRFKRWAIASLAAVMVVAFFAWLYLRLWGKV